MTEKVNLHNRIHKAKYSIEDKVSLLFLPDVNKAIRTITSSLTCHISKKKK